MNNGNGTFLRSKQTVTVTIEFLNWLNDHGITLAELQQEHLDAWLADDRAPADSSIASSPGRSSAAWSTPNSASRGTAEERAPSCPSPNRTRPSSVWSTPTVVHTDELTARDRAAAILVIVFGQRIEDVIQLTWNDVTVTDDVVTVRLGKTEFALPSPLDEPMRQLAAAPGNDLTASHPNSNWVFRGYSPGRHIHGSSLRSRLKTVFSTRAARLGTLHELTKLGPVPVIADALGYHPSTIERHAIGSASTYAEYIAAARELRQTS